MRRLGSRVLLDRADFSRFVGLTRTPCGGPMEERQIAGRFAATLNEWGFNPEGAIHADGLSPGRRS